MHAVIFRQVMILVCLVLLPATGSLRADESQVFDTNVDEAATGSGSSVLEPGSAEFESNPAKSLFGWWPEDLVLAPVPGYSPEFGWTMALMAGYFLDLNGAGSDPAPSLVAAYGMTTENNSSAYALAGNLHFLNDRLRVAAIIGNVDFRYRYWGTGGDAGDAGISINIRQKAPVLYLSGRYEVLPNLYAGVGYLGGKTETSLRVPLPLPPGLDDPTLTVDMAAVQLPIDYDTRDDRYFPRSGWFGSVRATFYRESVGSDFDADIVTLAVNHYLPLRERDVLASRAYFKSAGGDAPFFLLSSFGGKTDLRGYDMGRYRDNMMYAVQTEYRWRYSNKWVFTGFAGVGEVADNLGGFFNELLPAGGIGARFMLSEKHKISLSADLSFGKNGGQFYFGIGEAF